jgi:hypothetical protein
VNVRHLRQPQSGAQLSTLLPGPLSVIGSTVSYCIGSCPASPPATVCCSALNFATKTVFSHRIDSVPVGWELPRRQLAFLGRLIQNHTVSTNQVNCEPAGPQLSRKRSLKRGNATAAAVLRIASESAFFQQSCHMWACELDSRFDASTTSFPRYIYLHSSNPLFPAVYSYMVESLSL